MTVVDTFNYLGGEQIFGHTIASELEFAAAVERGLPSGSLDQVLQTLSSDQITQGAIYSVVGSPRSLQRKRREKVRLSHGESDRLARLARLAVRAGEALGSSEKGNRWLGKPNRALAGQRPLDLLISDIGAILVEDELGRLEHGVLA